MGEPANADVAESASNVIVRRVFIFCVLVVTAPQIRLKSNRILVHSFKVAAMNLDHIHNSELGIAVS